MTIDLPVYIHCRLCGEQRELRESHVIPKFYWEWMKETGDQYFRDPRQPNRRLQDGVKLRMLCADCEERFSKVETPFSASVFRPLMADPTASVGYGPFVLRFLISALWRNLALDLDAGNTKPALREELEGVENEWRQYLLERAELARRGRVHLRCTDFALVGSPQYNRYLTRDADATAMWTDERGLIGYYLKFAKVIVCAELAPFDTEQWINTLVSPIGGKINPGSVRVLDGRFAQFIIDRALSFEQYRQQGVASLSLKQRQKVRTRFDENAERLAKTEMMRALMTDHAWNQSIPKVGRNEPCPCGSGRKYKKCHGD